MNKKTCFVISKIEDNPEHYSNVFYEGIVEAAIGEDFEIVRADKIRATGNIYNDIINYLENSDLVVTDLTDLDPNVLYELGYREKVGKPIIQFIQVDHDLPSSLLNKGIIEYKTDFRGLEKAKKDLVEYVSNINFDKYIQRTENFSEMKTFVSSEISKLANEIKTHPRGNCFQRILEKYSDKLEDADDEELHDKLSRCLSDVFAETFEYTDVQALANVFTPEGVVKEHEGKAKEVWVATTKLDKDVRDEKIRDVVRQNMKEGKKYTYFVPKTKDVYKNMQLYQEEFSEFNRDNDNLYRFVILPEDSIVFFEEIAIYYPRFPDQEIKGFASITIDDRDDAYIYVRQSPKIVKRYVEKLEKLLESGSKIEEIINKLHAYMSRKMGGKESKKDKEIKKVFFEITLDPWLTRKSFDNYYQKLKDIEAYDDILSVFENDIKPLLFEDIDYFKDAFLTEKSYSKIKEIFEATVKNKNDIKAFEEAIKHLIITKI